MLHPEVEATNPKTIYETNTDLPISSVHDACTNLSPSNDVCEKNDLFEINNVNYSTGFAIKCVEEIIHKAAKDKNCGQT